MIINLCSHDVTEINSGVTFPPSGIVARLERKDIFVGFIDGVPVTRANFGKVNNLPEQKDGVYYIVSKHVVDALPDRDDLLAPGPVVRDERHFPIGCNGFMAGRRIEKRNEMN